MILLNSIRIIQFQINNYLFIRIYREKVGGFSKFSLSERKTDDIRLKNCNAARLLSREARNKRNLYSEDREAGQTRPRG